VVRKSKQDWPNVICIAWAVVPVATRFISQPSPNFTHQSVGGEGVGGIEIARPRGASGNGSLTDP